MSATTHAEELLLDAAEVRARPRRPLKGSRGVEHALLWHRGEECAGVLHLQPGAEMPAHRHDHASHHVWVITGIAIVDGRELGPGSYWYIPPRTDHRVQAGPDGCELHYLYLLS
jgi:quercetin dioxygenase-like cupin family protein